MASIVVTDPSALPPAPEDLSPEQLASEVENKLNVEAKVETKEEEEPVVSAYGPGLHPHDKDAEVIVGSGSIYRSAQTFHEIGLSEQLLSGVFALGFVQPSRIQGIALPIIAANPPVNLIGQAHHGSGKTAAFSLGMLCRVDPARKVPQALCVAPTRELANQIAEVVRALAKFTEIKVYCAVKDSQRGPVDAQVVIGTPGSILDKLQRNDIPARDIRVLVCDEADQMVSSKQGHGEQTMRIKTRLPRDVQILLFSATFPDSVTTFAQKFAPRAEKITVKREDLTLEGIKQFYIDCQSVAHKYEVLTTIYGLLTVGQSIIFVHTVATAKDLANKLRRDNYTVSLLCGEMPPDERDLVMKDFREGKTSVLVTTNVLARGIDVLQVTLVLNYDLPMDRDHRPDPETYIHRIGRSGRWGRKGVAINFVHDSRSREHIGFFQSYYRCEIAELSEDYEVIERTVNDALKSN